MSLQRLVPEAEVTSSGAGAEKKNQPHLAMRTQFCIVRCMDVHDWHDPALSDDHYFFYMYRYTIISVNKVVANIVHTL